MPEERMLYEVAATWQDNATAGMKEFETGLARTTKATADWIQTSKASIPVAQQLQQVWQTYGNTLRDLAPGLAQTVAGLTSVTGAMQLGMQIIQNRIAATKEAAAAQASWNIAMRTMTIGPFEQQLAAAGKAMEEFAVRSETWMGRVINAVTDVRKVLSGDLTVRKAAEQAATDFNAAFAQFEAPQLQMRDQLEMLSIQRRLVEAKRDAARTEQEAAVFERQRMEILRQQRDLQLQMEQIELRRQAQVARQAGQEARAQYLEGRIAATGQVAGVQEEIDRIQNQPRTPTPNMNALSFREGRQLVAPAIASLAPELAGPVFQGAQALRLGGQVASSGAVVAGLALGGIGIAVTALAAYMNAANQAAQAQASLNLAVRAFDTSGLHSQLVQLHGDLELIEVRSKSVAGSIVNMTKEFYQFATGTPTERQMFRDRAAELAILFEKTEAVASSARGNQAVIAGQTGLNAQQLEAERFRRGLAVTPQSLVESATREGELLRQAAELQQRNFDEEARKLGVEQLQRLKPVEDLLSRLPKTATTPGAAAPRGTGPASPLDMVFGPDYRAAEGTDQSTEAFRLWNDLRRDIDARSKAEKATGVQDPGLAEAMKQWRAASASMRITQPGVDLDRPPVLGPSPPPPGFFGTEAAIMQRQLEEIQAGQRTGPGGMLTTQEQLQDLSKQITTYRAAEEAGGLEPLRTSIVDEYAKRRRQLDMDREAATRRAAQAQTQLDYETQVKAIALQTQAGQVYRQGVGQITAAETEAARYLRGQYGQIVRPEEYQRFAAQERAGVVGGLDLERTDLVSKVREMEALARARGGEEPLGERKGLELQLEALQKRREETLKQFDDRIVAEVGAMNEALRVRKEQAELLGDSLMYGPVSPLDQQRSEEYGQRVKEGAALREQFNMPAIMEQLQGRIDESLRLRLGTGGAAIAPAESAAIRRAMDLRQQQEEYAQAARDRAAQERQDQAQALFRLGQITQPDLSRVAVTGMADQMDALTRRRAELQRQLESTAVTPQTEQARAALVEEAEKTSAAITKVYRDMVVQIQEIWDTEDPFSGMVKGLQDVANGADQWGNRMRSIVQGTASDLGSFMSDSFFTVVDQGFKGLGPLAEQAARSMINRFLSELANAQLSDLANLLLGRGSPGLPSRAGLVPPGAAAGGTTSPGGIAVAGAVTTAAGAAAPRSPLALPADPTEPVEVPEPIATPADPSESVEVPDPIALPADPSDFIPISMPFRVAVAPPLEPDFAALLGRPADPLSFPFSGVGAMSVPQLHAAVKEIRAATESVHAEIRAAQAAAQVSPYLADIAPPLDQAYAALLDLPTLAGDVAVEAAEMSPFLANIAPPLDPVYAALLDVPTEVAGDMETGAELAGSIAIPARPPLALPSTSPATSYVNAITQVARFLTGGLVGGQRQAMPPEVVRALAVQQQGLPPSPTIAQPEGGFALAGMGTDPRLSLGAGGLSLPDLRPAVMPPRQLSGFEQFVERSRAQVISIRDTPISQLIGLSPPTTPTPTAQVPFSTTFGDFAPATVAAPGGFQNMTQFGEFGEIAPTLPVAQGATSPGLSSLTLGQGLSVAGSALTFGVGLYASYQSGSPLAGAITGGISGAMLGVQLASTGLVAVGTTTAGAIGAGVGALAGIGLAYAGKAKTKQEAMTAKNRTRRMTAYATGAARLIRRLSQGIDEAVDRANDEIDRVEKQKRNRQNAIARDKTAAARAQAEADKKKKAGVEPDFMGPPVPVVDIEALLADPNAEVAHPMKVMDEYLRTNVLGDLGDPGYTGTNGWKTFGGALKGIAAEIQAGQAIAFKDPLPGGWGVKPGGRVIDPDHQYDIILAADLGAATPPVTFWGYADAGDVVSVLSEYIRVRERFMEIEGRLDLAGAGARIETAAEAADEHIAQMAKLAFGDPRAAAIFFDAIRRGQLSGLPLGGVIRRLAQLNLAGRFGEDWMVDTALIDLADDTRLGPAVDLPESMLAPENIPRLAAIVQSAQRGRTALDEADTKLREQFQEIGEKAPIAYDETSTLGGVSRRTYLPFQARPGGPAEDAYEAPTGQRFLVSSKQLGSLGLSDDQVADLIKHMREVAGKRNMVVDLGADDFMMTGL